MKQFYLVYYAKDGTIHLWPAKTQEECIALGKKMMKDKDRFNYCEATNVIFRDTETFANEKLFGIKDKFNFKNIKEK